MGKKNQTKDMNVPIQNAVIFFPSNGQTHKILSHVEDYCRWGISLSGLAEKLKYKTSSGALKFLQRIASRISQDHVFEEFKPESVDIFHADEIETKEHGKPVYRLFIRGGFSNKIVYAWGFSHVRNIWIIHSMIRAAIRHNHKSPKIWVTDGLPDYHTSLVNQYGKNNIRTIFLGRNPDNNITFLNTEEKERAFSISKKDKNLIIHKGLINSCEFMQQADQRHYTTTIETVLRLFKDDNASCVFIEAFEKTLPFNQFSKRFLNIVKEDGYTYHFIGHGTNGNTLAEIFARQIAHRISWFNKTTHSVTSARLIFHLQMIVYNLFGSLDGPNGPSPFEKVGVKVGKHENAWRRLLPIL